MWLKCGTCNVNASLTVHLEKLLMFSLSCIAQIWQMIAPALIHWCKMMEKTNTRGEILYHVVSLYDVVHVRNYISFCCVCIKEPIKQNGKRDLTKKDELFPNLQNDRFMSTGRLIALILKVGKCQDLAGDITADFPISFQWLRAMTQHISALHR